MGQSNHDSCLQHLCRHGDEEGASRLRQVRRVSYEANLGGSSFKSRGSALQPVSRSVSLCSEDMSHLQNFQDLLCTDCFTPARIAQSTAVCACICRIIIHVHIFCATTLSRWSHVLIVCTYMYAYSGCMTLPRAVQVFVDHMKIPYQYNFSLIAAALHIVKHMNPSRQLSLEPGT